MNENLHRLIRLQELMTSMAELQDRTAGIPVEVARLEKDLLAVESEVNREKAALGELQKERRRLEMELMGVETRIQKYQAQLAEVKTNKEYQAMQHEIETCRSERAALDEKILLDMEQAEKAQAAARVLDERLAEKRRETDRGKDALRQKTAALEAERKRLEGQRDDIAKQVPPDLLETFLRKAKSRRGVGLVPVRDELCGGCHVRVMPKLIQEIRRSTGLIACNSCSRFLFVQEDLAGPPGGAAPSGGSAPGDDSSTGGPGPGGAPPGGSADPAAASPDTTAS